MGELLLAIVLGVLFLGLLFFWFGRFFYETGCLTGEKKKLFTGKITFSGEVVLKNEITQVFLLALAIRLLVYLAGGAWMLLNSQETTFSLQNFLEQWGRWDATHYMKLAELGYEDYIENGEHLFLVFFPLYPWLMRALHLLVGNWQLCGMLISTLAFCVGSCYFYAFVKEEFGKEIAEKSYIFLAVYPFSFFFGGIMTESLFFCLLSAGFYYIAKHRFLLAGVIGILLSLCRIQGILLLGVGLVEFFITSQPGKRIREKQFRVFWKEFFTRGIWLFLIPVGNLIYFYLNYRVEGDFFRFRYYQEHHWYHTTTWVPNCLREIIGYVFDNNMAYGERMAIWIPELVIFVLTVVCLIYMIPTHPLKYSAFLLVYTMVNYSVTFLISGGRYMACALPLFIVLADIAGKHPMLYRGIVFLGMLLFGVYFMGFFMGFQIM